MRNLLWLFVVAMVVSGCATTAGYEAVLNTWTGQNINNLVGSWGYPESTFAAPNGNTVYVYSTGGNLTMPTQTSYTGQVTPWGSYSGSSYTTGGQTLNFWYRTFFEVDKNKNIVSSRWEGNNCVANMPKNQLSEEETYHIQGDALEKSREKTFREQYSEYYERKQEREKKFADLRNLYDSEQISLDDFLNQRKEICKEVFEDFNKIKNSDKASEIELYDLGERIKPTCDGSKCKFLDIAILQKKKEQGKLTEEQFLTAEKKLLREYADVFEK